MTIAELHGKIDPLEYREDLLTSDVFGTFKYIGYNHGLKQLLEQAINIQGELLTIPDSFSSAEYFFWPHMKDDTEPDVLIILKNNEKEVILILVEAKYLASKGYYEEEAEEGGKGKIYDQLATEFQNLQNCSFRNITIDESSVKNKVLLYITSHYSIPKKVINESIERLREGEADAKNKIFWVSWREIPKIIEKKYDDWKEKIGTPACYLLVDLKKLLIRKNLTKFDGFKELANYKTPTYIGNIFLEGVGFNGFKNLKKHAIDYSGSKIFLINGGEYGK